MLSFFMTWMCNEGQEEKRLLEHVLPQSVAAILLVTVLVLSQKKGGFYQAGLGICSVQVFILPCAQWGMNDSL